MTVLTVAEIDSELAARGKETDAITATLLELDKHPGLGLLRGYPPEGVTAARWQPVQAALDLMWEDYGRLQSILEQARAVRARRHRPTDADRAELSRLLRDRPYEVSRTPIPLAQRSLTGPEERVLFVGIADVLDRMRDTFPKIAAFLDSVDAINTQVLEGLSPLQAQLDEFGGGTDELRAIAAGVAELLTRSATDPLALTDTEIDTRIGNLADRLRHEAEGLTELRAVLRRPAAISDTRARLDELRATRERAEQAHAEAQRKILTAPLTLHPAQSGALRTELEALTGRATADPTNAHQLLTLRRRIAAAQTTATADEQLAQGLLARRVELRGRLAAYQAKAARVGISEDRDVLACNRIATGLLARTPCDLAAVTRAVADYQQIIAEKTGRRR